ncbi:uncharacterized protein LOC131876295 [Cryptomeria japonica]|uniref:uncharacterized protein LOC131876295 n=1 Tax=Cryptomeria japonica TaxID=3369 RepID=UPI0027D9D72D|nr:uncharacterized protein LOC131876295 [Cryptomeria japonica]
MSNEPMDKEGFIPVKPRNKGKGKKRSWLDRQNEDTFNKFEVLDNLTQEEGIPVEISSGDKGLHEVQDENEKKEDQIVSSEVHQVDQMAVALSSQAQDFRVLQGSQTLLGSVVVVLDPPAPKGASESVKGNKAPSILGLQQKSFKKGPLDKPSKSGRKTDQEKVKIMGDTLVELGQKAVRRLIESQSPDVVFIQETKLSVDGLASCALRKSSLWAHIQFIRALDPFLPWIMAGDFNAVTCLDEKRGGLARLDPSANLLRNMIGSLNLIDVKPTNGVFTWNNRRCGGEAISERLDRFLVSCYWLNSRLITSSEILDWRGFDHWPIKLSVTEGRPTHGTAMFIFTKRLQHVKFRLKRWNKQCFGNLQAQKLVAQSKLDSITRQIRDQGLTSDLSIAESLALKGLEEWELWEEIFWKQKSRIDWLQEGDRNIAFFHNSVKARRQGNSISSLVSQDGAQLSSSADISREAVYYFSNLFSREDIAARAEEGAILDCIPQLVSAEMNGVLLCPILLPELEKVVFNMKKGKAPGPDGFPIEFFQEFWEIIKFDLLEVIQESHRNKQMLKSMNSTFLALIPKMEGANRLAQFRPIALCNVVYKIITKLIAERLKPLLGSLISAEQGGFVEGRQILDGIMIAMEAIHSMANSKEKAMFIKLDMSKAYDRGDPLSPYLFIIMAEGLGRFIKSQFVDDTGLMGLARISEAVNFRRALDIYLKASGQCINDDKSSIYFFNTPQCIQSRIARILRFQIGSLPLMYLGIPLALGAQRRDYWKGILDKFRSKVSHWTHRWLSSAGRMVLLKTVVQSLPIYRCCVQAPPSAFVREFDALSRQFLWSGNLLSSKWSLVKWESVCRPKHAGGLGLRSMALAVTALAAKLYWRWCNNQDQDWAKILAHKYLPGVDCLDVPRLHLLGKGSCIWDTLKKGAQLIKEGLFWICNRGSEALFWQDSWDGHPPILSSFPQLQPLCNIFSDAGWIKVEHFKTVKRTSQATVACWKDPQEWPLGGSDEDRDVLVRILKDRLCSSLNGRDVLAWSPSPKGKFIVAQGYARLDKNLHGPAEVHWWKKVWDNFSWPKCNFFLWLLAQRKCLTWENLRKRGFQGPSICLLCSCNEECTSHLFFLCPYSRELWHRWWEAWQHGCIHATSLIDFWESLGRPPTKTSFLQVAWSIGPTLILWNLWLERNRRVFCGSNLGISQLWKKILSRLQETISAKCNMSVNSDPGDLAILQNLNLGDSSRESLAGRRSRHVRQRVSRDGRWTPPPVGVLKINIDGSSRGNPGHAGVGGIGRGNDGGAVFVFSIYKGQHSNNLMEALAIKIAVERGYSLGWRRIICESDSQIVVDMLNNQKLEDVSWQLAFVVGEWNRVADCLAKWASENVDDWDISGRDELPSDYLGTLERLLVEDRRKEMTPILELLGVDNKKKSLEGSVNQTVVENLQEALKCIKSTSQTVDLSVAQRALMTMIPSKKLSQRRQTQAIAQLLNVSRRTVQRYVRQKTGDIFVMVVDPDNAEGVDYYLLQCTKPKCKFSESMEDGDG